MPSIYHMVPRDVQLALTEFSSAFDKAFALGDVEQWAGMIGNMIVSDSIRTVFPLPLGAAGYKLREGDDKMRRLYERSMAMSPVEWVDGVKEKAKIVEVAGDWIGWASAPADMAAEALRHANVLVADMLAQNPYLDFYRVERPGGSTASARTLFASDHPFNVLDSSYGTFDNDWDDGDTVQDETVPTEINATLVKICRKHFRSICGPNGRPLGLRFAGFLIPAAHEEEAADAFKRDALLEALATGGTADYVGGVAPNRFFNTPFIVGDELTGDLPSGSSGDEDTIYAYATKQGGLTPPPWVVQRGSTTEEIRYDKDSEMYKDSGFIGVKEVLSAAAAGALPHAIVRIDLSH